VESLFVGVLGWGGGEGEEREREGRSRSEVEKGARAKNIGGCSQRGRAPTPRAPKRGASTPPLPDRRDRDRAIQLDRGVVGEEREEEESGGGGRERERTASGGVSLPLSLSSSPPSRRPLKTRCDRGPLTRPARPDGDRVARVGRSGSARVHTEKGRRAGERAGFFSAVQLARLPRARTQCGGAGGIGAQ
jgi:hypothetical protein